MTDDIPRDDQTDDQADDRADAALRDRLRGADPAAALPPADPSRVLHLLEETMSSPTDTDHPTVTESRATGTHGRSPLTWLVAAAAVLLIAGAGLFGILRYGGDQTPTATHEPTVTDLRAPTAAAYSARCLVPTPAALSQQDLAFDGTVTEIADGVVTLAPRHFYTGTPTELVRVRAPQADLRALVQAVKLEDGGRYLVAASDGRVAICGFSAEWNQRLAGLYTRAFAHRG